MIVVDTNVIAYLFIEGDRAEQAEAVFAKDPEWAAPFLWRSEFRNILALYMRQSIIALNDAKRLIEEAENLMAGREFELKSSEVLELAKNSGCSAYDCEFVALAKDLNVSLVTSDKKLLTSFPAFAISMDAYV